MIVSCLLAAITVDAFFISGLMFPVRVTSGSMAPSLLGPHWTWTCANCKEEFVCSLESLPANSRPVICPFCRTANDQHTGINRPGQRVLVDRFITAVTPLKRWDKVALDCPQNERDWCVKRIVGMPGERVQVRAGEVWIDGQIARKPVATMREMAVLVHRERSGGDAAQRRWSSPDGRWLWDGKGFQHRAETSGNDPQVNAPIRWLEYHHPQMDSGADGSDGQIIDESPTDQNESRAFSTVDDLLVTGTVTPHTAGTIAFRIATANDDEFRALFDTADGHARLEHNSQSVAMGATTALVPGRAVEFAWLLADRRVQLAIDGRVILRHSFVPSTASISRNRPRLAIGVRAGGLKIEELSVFRDVYYAAGPLAMREYRLGADEYFLLGDNSAHSQDSRTWPEPAISRQQIVGRVITW